MTSKTRRWSKRTMACGFAAVISVTAQAQEADRGAAEQNVDSLFSEIDQNNDQFLTWEELQGEAAQQIEESDIDVKSYDQNNDDRLSQQEFAALFADFKESAADTAAASEEQSERKVLQEESAGRIVVDTKPADVKVQQAEPQVNVQQKEPRVQVEQQEPRVQVEESAPNIRVEQQQPKVVVRQPQPEVDVEIPKPEVTVTDEQPKVEVFQEEPQVEIDVPEPDVQVSQPKPDVQVTQPEPDVRVEAETPEVVMEGAEPNVQVEESEARVQVEESAAPEVAVDRAEPQVAVEEAEPRVQIEGQDPEVDVQRPQGGESDRAAMTSGIYNLNPQTLRGRDVFNINGNQVGDIDEIVLRKADGKPFAVLEVGGFFGLGQEQTVVSLDELSLAGNRIVWSTALTEDTIEARARYEENNYTELRTQNEQESIGEAVRRALPAEWRVC